MKPNYYEYFYYQDLLPLTMDYITDYIPNTIAYKIYDELIYKTHIYIVNNLYNNHPIYNNYDDDEVTVDTLTVDTLTSLQYFNIMSFLD